MRIRTPLDLGLVIRHRRRKLGLSQSALAEMAGVGRQWLVAVERGKARAEVGLVLRTLDVLDLTLSADANAQDRTTARPDDIPSDDIDTVVSAHKRSRR